MFDNSLLNIRFKILLSIEQKIIMYKYQSCTIGLIAVNLFKIKHILPNCMPERYG